MMQPPTVTEDGGKTTFEFGSGLVAEVSKVENTRWGGTNVHLRVLDLSREESPLLAAATIRLDDLRERERFLQTLQNRDGKVDDWSACLLLIADHTSQRAPISDTAAPVTVRLLDIVREEVSWMSLNRLARGKLHMMDGDPGVGKTFATHAIASGVTTGAPLFGEGERREPAKVLILSGEDGPGDTIRPRIEDMHGDLSRVMLLTAVRKGDGEERQFSLIDDLAALEKVLSEGGYEVVIIDPINSYLGTDLDTNRDAALRSVLTPLAALAAKYNVAIILIRHLTKSSRDRPIYRGQGTIAYTAASRLAMIVGKNPDNERERVICWVKNNLGPEAPAIAFCLDDGQFRWLGETDVTASALVAPERGTEEHSALAEARAYLSEALADGQQPARDIEREAEGLGISKGTLRRAREALHIETIAIRTAGDVGVQRWDWRLPGGLGEQDAQLRKSAHLNPDSYPEQPSMPELVGHLNNKLPERPEEPPATNDEEAERDLCFSSAGALHFPEIALGPGRKVVGGKTGWHRFTQRQDLGVIRTAQAGLDQLGEAADG